MTKLRFLVPLLLFFQGIQASVGLAADPQAPTGAALGNGRPAAPAGGGAQPNPTNTPRKDNVLDFEGDLIEGSRVAPDLFLQQDIGDMKLDTVIYARDNFNDFHTFDRRRRPRYLQRKGSLRSAPRPAGGPGGAVAP